MCNAVRRMYRNQNAKQKLNKVSLGGEQEKTELQERDKGTQTLTAQVVPMLLTTLLMSEGEREQGGSSHRTKETIKSNPVCT